MPRGPVLAPSGGRFRCYGLHHLTLLRLWRHGVRLRGVDRLGERLAALWRAAPPHVAAEARAMAAFARPGQQAEGVLDRLLANRAFFAPELGGRRVVMLTPSLALGGAERQLVLAARGLVRRGWAVEVIAKHLGDPVGSDHLRPQLDGVLPLREIPGERLHPALGDEVMGLPPLYRETVVRLTIDFLKTRPRVVHAWMDEMAAVGGLAAALAGVPRIILAGRNMAPPCFSLPDLPFLRQVIRRLADHPGVSLINNSIAGAVDYGRWLGIDPSRITVLRNGFEPFADQGRERCRAALGFPDAGLLVGGAFRLAEEKRPLLWLETVAVLSKRNPSLRFVLFGEGPLRHRVEAAIPRLGLEGRVTLAGVNDDRAMALGAMDVFLLTSRYEGTPNVLLECQWLGVPVVATHAGGVAECLEEAMVLPLEAEAYELAQAVEAAMGLARRPRRNWISSHFGLERMIEETEACYLERLPP